MRTLAEKERIGGLDLMKGVAAFCVVMIHVGGGQVLSSGSERLKCALTIFAVPFFLVTAHYFSAASEIRGAKLLSRSWLLVKQFILWSVVYLGFRGILYIATGRWGALQSMALRVPEDFLTGGAAVHLYFLPLLLVGTLLNVGFSWIAPTRIKSPAFLSVLILGALALYQWWIGSKSVTIPSILRVWTFWVIWSLPFIFASYLVAKVGLSVPKHWSSFGVLLAMAFLSVGTNILTTFGVLPLPYAIAQMLVAWPAFFFAVWSSPFLSIGKWCESLGTCALGIYLLHHLVLEAVELLSASIWHPASTTLAVDEMLLLAVATFFLTWGCVQFSRRWPTIAWHLFGIKTAEKGTGVLKVDHLAVAIP